MLHYFKKLFGFSAKVETPVAEVPYKVETPVAVPIISQPVPTTNLVDTPTVSPIAEQASQAVVESIAKPAKKSSGKRKTTSAKKPRGPKTPKSV